MKDFLKAQDKNFRDMRDVLNAYFIHNPCLCYEMPRLRRLLVEFWDQYKILGPGLNGVVTRTNLTSPIGDRDYARCYAYLIFLWRIGNSVARRRILKELQILKEKIGGPTPECPS